MLRFVFALAVAALLVHVQPAAAKRVALVVGNSAYKHVAVLVNPKNDAESVAAALARLDFDVIMGINLTRPDFVSNPSNVSFAGTTSVTTAEGTVS